MFGIVLSRRNIGYFIIGLLIIFGFHIVLQMLNFAYIQYLFSNTSPTHLKDLTVNLPLYAKVASLLTTIIGFLSFVVGGCFVGRKIKSKELLYGASLGIIYFIIILIIQIIFIALSFFLPKELIYGSKIPLQMYKLIRDKNTIQFTQTLLFAPLNLLKVVALTTFGGFLAKHSFKKK